MIEYLSGVIDSIELRVKAGLAILDLLPTNYFVSSVWSPDERKFCVRIFVNMD